MSFNPYTPEGWWERTRMMRYIFAAGVVLGIFVGWFFHGLISMAIQFGVVIVLLLPLALLGYMWWRSTRQRGRPSSRMTVMRWDSGQFPPYGNDMAADTIGRVRLDQDDVIDVNHPK